MISHHETLEDGDIKHRCQVVRWVRSFPFAFLSDREYIIGRRVWRAEDGCLYGEELHSAFDRACLCTSLLLSWPSSLSTSILMF